MVHLRIVAAREMAGSVLELLERFASVINIIHLAGAARRPPGDVIMCDVAREDASLVLEKLRRLGVPRDGSIAVEAVDTALSDAADAAEKVAEGAPSDAVIWEEVAERTSETASLSWAFLVFMVLAALIAAVGILLESPILIVGAMVVGPEFGPMAGFCVAAVQRRARLAGRSFVALAVGFPAAIATVLVATLAFQAIGVTPERFVAADHPLARTIASPAFFTAFVAFCAGVAGMLSLTTAKSGALIGVLISVTTIPAAANVGVAAAYGDGDGFAGSLGQLATNVACVLVAGTLTLTVQRAVYHRHRANYERRVASRSRELGLEDRRHEQVHQHGR
jgi:uncharacterized hydrophobic protein (TIGR00271 family)